MPYQAMKVRRGSFFDDKAENNSCLDPMDLLTFHGNRYTHIYCVNIHIYIYMYIGYILVYSLLDIFQIFLQNHRWITPASPYSSTAMTTTGWWSISPPGRDLGIPWERWDHHEFLWGNGLIYVGLCWVMLGSLQLFGKELDYT